MAESHSFNSTVQGYLHESGWSEGRLCDVEIAARLLQEKGFVANEHVLTFLSEFDGLLISFPNPRMPSAVVRYSFGSVMRIDLVSESWVKHWERWSEDILCPIGTDHRGYGVVLLDASGVFYFGYDANLFEIARNVSEFFDRLISRESWRTIEVDVPY